MGNTSLRIHPAIGMARVGNSPDYYLGPETMAASPQEGTEITGGLPIKKGTESTTINSSDLRDAQGQLKKQAARFKIFQYPNSEASVGYPAKGGDEVIIGSIVDNKKVVDIIWTVHLANKKANCWEIDEVANKGVKLYENGHFPPLRNLNFKSASSNPSDPTRLKKLVIDAGPRAIQASKGTIPVKFNSNTKANYYDINSGGIVEQPNYPIQFPASQGSSLNGSAPIDYLGEILTETNGRLLVLGGFGLACAFDNDGNYDPNQNLCKDVDNDNWLDDTSDGVVNAVLVFEDGTKHALEGSAWVVVTDPAYAPQTLNVVSLWDDVYNTWLEKFNLRPEVFSNGKYNVDYKPFFLDDVYPTLNAAHMQMWNTNLPSRAIDAHYRMMQLTENKPSIDIMQFIRNPDGSQDDKGAPLMPLSLGDSDKGFLSLSRQQYFFMQQWNNGLSPGATPIQLGEGEQLDKTILVNCLGGRFSPGIDMTFIARDPNLYNQDWKNPSIGTFRINAKGLDYSQVNVNTPFLGIGYIPLRPDQVEPGDLCKFMSIPWHTDYNSCATHTPAPNPGGTVNKENLYSGDVNTTLFWSWPAQRPVAVYTFEDLMANTSNNGALPEQRFSLRGKGTAAVENLTPPGCPVSGDFDMKAMNVGRYQNRRDFLTEWVNVGTIIQGPAIDDYPEGFDKKYYLEVASNFKEDDSNEVVFWPNVVDDEVYPPKA
ncbi:LodA/GoxA family CTQ-dependent oxidase [Mariniflexile sp. AS56]|uniref:LodA/GoxA family CTQ-dependent oxidase n=1 Tax=Mariniflexile sp. AS56 TaxID=3063957 RepID=UPI0026EBFACF|nr:LodA/GoxA family CTQ-dependent oxidase [Mariniflexile sp. AS56]MDO7172665.1 LodA/GoxA family CTQ-dependent oxidase [Mariniflexile sp. AS56]